MTDEILCACRAMRLMHPAHSCGRGSDIHAYPRCVLVEKREVLRAALQPGSDAPKEIESCPQCGSGVQRCTAANGKRWAICTKPCGWNGSAAPAPTQTADDYASSKLRNEYHEDDLDPVEPSSIDKED